MTTITQKPVAGQQTVAIEERPSILYSLIWRFHFYAGVLIAPLLLWIAITGLLFVFNPQIEDVLYRDLYFVEPQATVRSYDEQLAAVRAAFPGMTVKHFVPSSEPNRTTVVLIEPLMQHTETEHDDHSSSGEVLVYVNPATATVVGQMAVSQRFKATWGELHRNFSQDDFGRMFTELGASWLLILLISGLFLWFPRTGAKLRGVFVPRFKARGRLIWRDLHSIGGIFAWLVLLLLVLTGLNWSQFAGELYEVTRETLGHSTPELPEDMQSTATNAQPIGLQQVAEIAQSHGVVIAYQIAPPQDDRGVYVVATTDQTQPTKWMTLAIDQYSGAVLGQIGWNDYPLLAKAEALGVPFHRGELFGLPNQLLITAAAVMVIFSVISGAVMWWKRRPAGSFGAPKRVAIRQVPKGAIVIFILIAFWLPTAWVSFVIIWLLDRFIVRSLLSSRRLGQQSAA